LNLTISVPALKRASTHSDGYISTIAWEAGKSNADTPSLDIWRYCLSP
jgi:hypothetical protein